ncbi:nucleoside hydrolase [Georgenia halophila]|uniref:Nucleoside hydrolase n=1 Tax=Georgenia halophila TaxID=620889 RepID=A0ABP8LNU6_9MICO
MITSTTSDHRVILDCDPGNGVPATDIDDGLALGLLLASPRVQVEAVTIVTGNTHRDVGYRVARTMLDDLGSDVPVYAGAATALVEPPAPWATRRDAARGGDDAAALWAGVDAPREYDDGHDYSGPAEIAHRVAAEPGEITLVAVGPLTNIAHAMALHPGLARDAKRIVIMGGGFDVPGFLQELNFGVDPEAARIVLASGADITLVPLDVTITTTLRLEDVDRLAATQTPLAQYLATTTAPWIRYCESAREMVGCRLHDPLAAAVLLEPDLVSTERCSVDVQLTGLVRSRPVRWHRDGVKLATGIDLPETPEIDVVTGVDNDCLVALLLSELSRPAAGQLAEMSAR